jgi:uncharacterized protein
MSRPPCCRKVDQLPNAAYFKPRGIPLRDLEEVALTVDELEAIRLADLEGYYQEAAAEKMNVSRQTFGRIITEAHRKVADFLIGGKALLIGGGNFTMENMRTFTCDSCQHTWQIPYGTGRPQECPKCQSASLHRIDGGRGGGQRHGRNAGHCKHMQHRVRQDSDLASTEIMKSDD